MIAQAALDLFGDADWAGFAMEAVARRAGVGKASLYLRWSSKEALLVDALSLRMARVSDVDTGTLRGDLIELAVQMLDLYAGPGGCWPDCPGMGDSELHEAVRCWVDSPGRGSPEGRG
jgi:AcrR family transcriptional regulator